MEERDSEPYREEDGEEGEDGEEEGEENDDDDDDEEEEEEEEMSYPEVSGRGRGEKSVLLVSLVDFKYLVTRLMGLHRGLEG